MSSAAVSRTRSRIGRLVSDSLALTGRSLRHMVRQVDALLLSVILPVLLLLLFVYVFGGAMAIGTRYLDYVIPGIVVLTAGYGASQAAIAVGTDLASGSVDRFRSLPLAPASLLAGHVLASLLRNLLSTAIVVAVAVALGFRPAAGAREWLGVLAVVGLYVLALTWVSVLVGVLASSVDAAGGFSFLVLFLP
ncbi:MAG TPA: ABC transporter permease, partial [Egibacteraceae bacterium]